MIYKKFFFSFMGTKNVPKRAKVSVCAIIVSIFCPRNVGNTRHTPPFKKRMLTKVP